MITVIGDALLDVRVLPARAPRPGVDVPAEIRLEPGGQGSNVAVRLARQGLQVRLTCAVGTDMSGDVLRGRLAMEGIEVHDLGAPATGVVVVLLDERRERTMLSHRVPFGPDVSRIAPPADGWLVVSGYVLLEPEARVPAGGDRRALLGCSLDSSGAAAWLERARAMAPHLVMLNSDEAVAIVRSQQPPAELARILADRLSAIVVVTHETGATAVAGGQHVDVRAAASGPIVDATGAGDAFAASLIAGLGDDVWPPDVDRLGRAMAGATDLAGAVARVPGAQGHVEGEQA